MTWNYTFVWMRYGGRILNELIAQLFCVGVKYPASSPASILNFLFLIWPSFSLNCIDLLLYSSYSTTAEANSSWKRVEKKIFG